MRGVAGRRAESESRQGKLNDEIQNRSGCVKNMACSVRVVEVVFARDLRAREHEPHADDYAEIA
jgi:hypothetical protein